jgi:hypothetical protein
VDLFLASLFCSIDLCVCLYANTMLFWLLQFYSIFWNQVQCIQLCSFCKLLGFGFGCLFSECIIFTSSKTFTPA